MTTIVNIKVPSDEWVDVYTETGISELSALILQNKGSYKVKLCISDTEPDLEEENCFSMDSFRNYYSRFDIDADTGRVWLLSESSINSVVVQEI